MYGNSVLLCITNLSGFLPYLTIDILTTFFSPDNEDDISCTIPKVVSYIQNVKNVRAFGLLLKIDQGRLDEIEHSSSGSRLKQIVQEWLKNLSDEVSDAQRWEELGRVLLAPAVYEPAIACRLGRYLRRGSSVDSAISDIFSDISSSPTSPLPPGELHIHS